MHPATVDCCVLWELSLELASEIQITCPTCEKMIAKLESPRSNSTKGNVEITNKEIEAKHFSINQQFILGCHEAGLGPGLAMQTSSVWVLVSARKLLCCWGACWESSTGNNSSCDARGMWCRSIPDTQCAWTSWLGRQRTWFAVVEVTIWYWTYSCAE